MWQTLLSPSFWFNLRPGSFSSPVRYAFLALIGLLIITAIVCFIIKRRKGPQRFIARKLYNFAVTNALIGFGLLFFNYEVVPFFSAHFWFLIWFIVMVWWKIYIIKRAREVNKKRLDSNSTDDLKKYLP